MKFVSLCILSLFSVTSGFAQRPVALDSVWKYFAYREASPEDFTSLHNGEYYLKTVTNADTREYFIVKYSFKTNVATDTVLRSSQLNLPDSFGAARGVDFTVDYQESRLLLSFSPEHIYRRSKRSYVALYDIKTKTCFPVGSGKISNAALSPDGKFVAYMQFNNVFIWDFFTKQPNQITKDGMKNRIINGACDWVYEEEFEFVDAIKWNANSSFIAFYKFDESKVPEYTIPFYRTGNYPENFTYKYAKAGEANSIVTIWTCNVVTGELVKCNLGSITYEYIPRIKWTQDPNVLCILTLNRRQNDLRYNLYSTVTANAENILRFASPTWIDVNDDLYFYNNNKNFIVTQSSDGWRHIYNYDIKGKLINKLTEGHYDVTALYGIDLKSAKVYYQSCERSPLQRQIYSIDMDGNGKKLLTSYAGWNDATFNATFAYFLCRQSSANSAPNYSLYNSNGQIIRLIEDNSELEARLSALDIAEKHFFTIPVTDRIKLNAWMIKPVNFNPGKTYPVLMHVYGGPGAQEVKDEFDLHWNLTWQYLAQHGYIIVCVDNRGTGARGEDFKTCTYKKLGIIETQDQIAAAKYLATLPYIDKNRIGMQGWSYGGFMACRCITAGADVFKAAVAIAPVTDWRFYDNIYTERYMQTPAENPAGYKTTSPINEAASLKGNFLLMHGMADDNVHYQNFADFVAALYKNDKTFTQISFPDKNHGISGGNTRYYLMHNMCDWIIKNL